MVLTIFGFLQNGVIMFFLRCILIGFAACMLMTSFAYGNVVQESEAQVWKVGQHRWTIHDEYRYGIWIEESVTEDFFIRHNIRVDCADVPYAMRWIYARIHHLPAAASTVDNRFIGHWSKDWSHLPTNPQWHKDRRFRAALLSVLSSTSTQTLPSDTYPIKIGRHAVTPGTVFLFAGDHAGIVSHVVMDGSTTHPVQTFEASSPARLQGLRLKDFLLPNPNADYISGLLKFRWPVSDGNTWRYLPLEEQPFYSDEQYTPAFTKGYSNYLEAVEKRINPAVYEPGEKADKIMMTLYRRLNERVPIVLKGYIKCHGMECPEGSLLWEIYSTYNRDDFIGFLLHYLEQIIAKNHLDRNDVLNNMEGIRLQITPGRFVTLRHVLENFKWISSDPEAGIEARWGLDKCSTITTRLRTAQESIMFIRNKYGETDPLFAEQSILKQQKIVDEMTRESLENNCMKNALR